MPTDRRRKIAARLIRSDDTHDQAVGWDTLRFLRARYPKHPENITEPRGGPLPEVRPGIYANTDDPALLAALETP